MVVVTTEHIHGYEIETVLGQVLGVVVRSRGCGGIITAALRSLGMNLATSFCKGQAHLC